jgi:dihydrofolate reductase
MSKPVIALVVAMDRQGVIGAKGKLPWHLPADLKHFRAITWGKPIVMGRKTHESIGRLLPGRENIVVSRTLGFESPGRVVVRSVVEALMHTREAPEVMVIGGAALYAEILPLAHRIYLTEVHAEFDGDTYFPPYDRAAWREQQRIDHPVDELNPYPYSFVLLERPQQGNQ